MHIHDLDVVVTAGNVGVWGVILHLEHEIPDIFIPFGNFHVVTIQPLMGDFEGFLIAAA